MKIMQTMRTIKLIICFVYLGMFGLLIGCIQDLKLQEEDSSNQQSSTTMSVLHERFPQFKQVKLNAQLVPQISPKISPKLLANLSANDEVIQYTISAKALPRESWEIAVMEDPLPLRIVVLQEGEEIGPDYEVQLRWDTISEGEVELMIEPVNGIGDYIVHFDIKKAGENSENSTVDADAVLSVLSTFSMNASEIQEVTANANSTIATEMLSKEDKTLMTPGMMSIYDLVKEELDLTTQDFLSQVNINTSNLVKFAVPSTLAQLGECANLYLRNKMVINPVKQGEVSILVAEIESKMKQKAVLLADLDNVGFEGQSLVDQVNKLGLHLDKKYEGVIKDIQEDIKSTNPCEIVKQFSLVASSDDSEEEENEILKDFNEARIISGVTTNLVEQLDKMVNVDSLENLKTICSADQINVDGVCELKVSCVGDEYLDLFTNTCLPPLPSFPKVFVHTPAYMETFLKDVLLSGECENDYQVKFSGDIVLNDEEVDCVDGEFEHWISLAGNNGIKEVLVSQEDTIGSISLDHRSLIKSDSISEDVTDSDQTTGYIPTDYSIVGPEEIALNKCTPYQIIALDEEGSPYEVSQDLKIGLSVGSGAQLYSVEECDGIPIIQSVVPSGSSSVEIYLKVTTITSDLNIDVWTIIDN